MDQTIFKKRRKEFLARLGEGVAVLVGGKLHERNPDVEYEFRQESNFYYLTGLEQPDAVAVFRPGVKASYVLFVEPRDAKKELWVGPSVGTDEAVKEYGADEADSIANFESRMKNFGSESTTLWYRLGSQPNTDTVVQNILEALQRSSRSGASAPESIRDPFPILAEMRLKKSKDEISALQKAVDITGSAFSECLKILKPGLKEYALRATLEYVFGKRGCVRSGYPAIVASGKGTCVLHNPSDRKTIGKNDLVLIDAGAEWEYYSADITRTMPASGVFSPEQRLIYDIVLEAQERAIAQVKPGARLSEIEQKAREFMIKELLKKKILISNRHPDPASRERRDEPGERSHSFMPHSLSHWLGMDVHDVGTYSDASLRGQSTLIPPLARGGMSLSKGGNLRRPAGLLRSARNDDRKLPTRPLEPGMVLTIEPGIYLRPGKEINREFWNIGIRIEDDILVTRSAQENLSKNIPKDPSVLERLLKRS